MAGLRLILFQGAFRIEAWDFTLNDILFHLTFQQPGHSES